MIRPQDDALGIFCGRKRLLAVARNVDDDGPRLAVRRDVERLRDGFGDLVCGMDEEVVLRNGAGEASRIGLLERVGAYLVERDLPADEHHRNAVHVRGAKPRDRVRKPRAARHDDYGRPSARAGVAVCHVDATLLVATEDELERRTGKLVEDVDDVAAGIAEDKLRPDPFKGLDERTRPSSLLRLQISRSGRIPRRAPSSPWRSS